MSRIKKLRREQNELKRKIAIHLNNIKEGMYDKQIRGESRYEKEKMDR
ncbi:MAG: hypothetical protein V1725_00065 [archaeon]